MGIIIFDLIEGNTLCNTHVHTNSVMQANKQITDIVHFLPLTKLAWCYIIKYK